MTDPIPLPRLLTAFAQEAADLSADLHRLEANLLPHLLPELAGRPDLAITLQGLDPLQQRLRALSRLTAEAAAEAPPHPMAASTACLHGVRLARFMRDLRPTQPPEATAATLFPPHP